MTADRHLDWDGCMNARDLGGLGGVRRGAVVRADALHELTARGWTAAVAHGVRTVIDLRNDDELRADVSPRPSEIRTRHLPLDAIEARDFWDSWTSSPAFGTPLYYGSHLARFPERSVRVLSAIAHAEPGGVAFHCGLGRDRTGMIAMLLLAIAGVSHDEIADDYALSRVRVPALHARRGEPDPTPELDAFYAGEGLDERAAIRRTLDALDLEAWRRAGGLSDADVAALRSRLLG